LHYASYQDDPGLVELLLLRGGTAMSMMKDNDGLTPLEVAQRHNPGMGYTSHYFVRLDC
jgi:hypothetical protein